MADIPRAKIMVKLQVSVENRLMERAQLAARLKEIDSEILAFREAQSHVDVLSQEQGV